MPTKSKSPFATRFMTAVKNGTPCSTAVCNISKKTNKPASTIWNSLCKSGVCNRQKFNGTWVYWPNFPVKKNASACNTMQTNMWQSFVEWCMCHGCCTPKQLNKNCTSQKSFMNYCRSFFSKQYTWNTSKSMTKRRASKPRKSPHSWPTSYKFPTFKTRPSMRRYVRAA